MDIGLTRVWAANGLVAGEPAPLLVVHDGPEYVRQARLTGFLAAGVRAGRLPPLRAALLSAGERRDELYSASDAYAAALVAALPGLAPPGPRIGMGPSLGALAMLHAQARHPGAFDALFLQSGSYFQPRLDSQESGFRFWDRIVGFVAAELAAGPAGHPVPVAMTCGADEENLANNREMAGALLRRRFPVTLRVPPGGHDFAGWRHALDPSLADLLARS